MTRRLRFTTLPTSAKSRNSCKVQYLFKNHGPSISRGSIHEFIKHLPRDSLQIAAAQSVLLRLRTRAQPRSSKLEFGNCEIKSTSTSTIATSQRGME